jgi:Short C-terminal domain
MRRLPMVLVVIATFLTFIAIFALWANRQLLNADNWAETSSALLENEDIRTQISGFLVDEVYANVDVEQQVGDLLPPRASGLAGPAATGLKTLSQNAVTNLLGRPRAQTLWEEANRRAAQRFIDILEGNEGRAVTTESGVVTLNLQEVLESSRGPLGSTVAGKLPEDAAQITIVDSDQLDLAQDVVEVLKVLALILLILAFGLYALAVYLARDRRRKMLRAVGFGFLVAGIAALAARSLAGDAVVSSLAKTEAAVPAAEATWSIGTSLLEEAASAAVLYGIALILAAWLAGPTRLAVGTRRGLAPWLREPGVAWGAFAVLMLLLVWWGPTPALRMPITTLLLVALLAAGFEVLRRQAAREFPDASREETLASLREWVGGLRRGRTAAPESDAVSTLERLAKLRDAGVLDEAEFNREKARVLGAAGAA